MSNNSLQPFHPALAAWFAAAFGEPTDVQRQAWRSIMSGNHTLIAAPTGSGKTLAALLPCLHAVAVDGGDRSGQGVRIVYLTPLKALNNDIQDHLSDFMEQLDALDKPQDGDWPGIRSAVRTGDTTASQRAAMFRRPPQLLITTPESLYILLTSGKGQQMLRTTTHVVVDEIHDLASDKRGAHMSLSLERLERCTGRPIQRIGVSATQNPLERVAQFLGGWRTKGIGDQLERRPVEIIESSMNKIFHLSVVMPDYSQSSPVGDGVWRALLGKLFGLIADSRSVILFVNSRRLCERLVLRMNDYAGLETARAHHGSMSRDKRLEAEYLLKSGQLRAIVATSSLELGIDVGHVDLVVQIDAPFDAASGIQRVGRAGHAVGEGSRGVFVVRQRGLLAEAAVLARQVMERRIEPIDIPEQPLDVLSQQAVAIAAAGDITVDELYRLALGSDSYSQLKRSRLEAMLAVLSGFYPFARPVIDWDRQSGLLTKRGNTAVLAMIGAGTIPQTSQYAVHHMESKARLGELDEEFIHESRVGDVFLLGSHSWMIRKIDQERVYVSEAANNFSEIPFWRNEGPGRSAALGMRVGLFIDELADRLKLDRRGDRERQKGWSDWSEADRPSEMEEMRPTIDWLATAHGMDAVSASQLIRYTTSQHAFSELPTAGTIVIEHYRDLDNRTHVIVLNPYGRRINRTWLLAIQRQFETTLPYRLYGNAKDNGIELVLPEWDEAWLQSIWAVTPGKIESLLTDAVSGSPLFAIAFRRIAETSLLLARSLQRVPMWQKRLRSENLLREALPYAESFPYLNEAMKECLYDYLDVTGLRGVLQSIQDGEIRIVVRETDYPSPMAAQFLADYVNMRIYEGDGLDPSAQAGLQQVSRQLAGELFGSGEEARRRRESAARLMQERLDDAPRRLDRPDDLLALLKQRGDADVGELIAAGGERVPAWLEQLSAEGRAAEVDLRAPSSPEPLVRWISSDETELYGSFPEEAKAAMFIAGRYADGRLSFTEPELCERYPALTLERARGVTELLREARLIVPAPFAEGDDSREWSASKLADQLVRLAVREGRREAASIAPEAWCGYLAARQYALHGTQLKGKEGLAAVITRLQGLLLPMSHWESALFPSRVAGYRKDDLDSLCAGGDIVWLGGKTAGQSEGKIAFFLSGSTELLADYLRAGAEEPCSHPELLELLQSGGASFLTGLARRYGKPPSETMADLLDLVWEGRVSNDQFAPLRVGAGGKGSDWSKTGSGFGRWYWTGTLGASEEATGWGEKEGTNASPASAPVAAPRSVYWIQNLLQCYGIVTKELIAAYTPFRWEEALGVMNRLEELGALTRGVFVSGAAAIQFTSPEIAGRLTAPAPPIDEAAATVIASTDPANPFGLFIDWPKASGGKPAYSRKPGNYVVLVGSQWRYWIEGNGKRVYELSGTGDDTSRSASAQQIAEMKAMFGVILNRQRLTKIVVEQWNGKPAEEASGLLIALGAERDQSRYVLWMSAL